MGWTNFTPTPPEMAAPPPPLKKIWRPCMLYSSMQRETSEVYKRRTRFHCQEQLHWRLVLSCTVWTPKLTLHTSETCD
jgi:hypothetical protein